MKKLMIIGATALTLGACTPREERTVAGGLIGGTAGALVGGAIGGGRGAAVGAVVGGVGGAAIGANTAPRGGRCFAYDEYGDRVRVPCGY